MKRKLTALLVLALLLSLCVLPAAAKSTQPEYEWLYTFGGKDAEEYYSVQVASSKVFKYTVPCCDLLRSYGYEAFVYYDGYYRVTVGLFSEDDLASARALAEDLKTLTRDDDSLAYACAAAPNRVFLKEEGLDKFSGFGGSAPAATATPKRTSTVLRAPAKSSMMDPGVVKYVNNVGHPGWRIYMYYGTSGDDGICGFAAHGDPVTVLATSGNLSYIRLSNDKEGWVENGFLQNSPLPTPTPEPSPVRMRTVVMRTYPGTWPTSRPSQQPQSPESPEAGGEKP